MTRIETGRIPPRILNCEPQGEKQVTASKHVGTSVHIKWNGNRPVGISLENYYYYIIKYWRHEVNIWNRGFNPRPCAWWILHTFDEKIMSLYMMIKKTRFVCVSNWQYVSLWAAFQLLKPQPTTFLTDEHLSKCMRIAKEKWSQRFIKAMPNLR